MKLKLEISKILLAASFVMMVVESAHARIGIGSSRMCGPGKKKVGSMCVSLPKPIQPPAPRGQSCADLYVGATLDNMVFNLVNNEASVNLHTSKYAKRTWHGGLRQEYSGKDRYWSDISSVRVYPGCTLNLWTGENRDGQNQVIYADANKLEVSSAGLLFPGNVGSAACSCEAGLTFDGFALYAPALAN